VHGVHADIPMDINLQGATFSASVSLNPLVDYRGALLTGPATAVFSADGKTNLGGLIFDRSHAYIIDITVTSDDGEYQWTDISYPIHILQVSV